MVANPLSSLAMFLAVAMHFENDKNVVMKLCKKVFKKELLGELDRVVVNIDEELSALKPHDYDILIWMNNWVPRYPILSIEDPIAFEAYNPIRRRNIFFLVRLQQVRKPTCNRWLANYLEAENIEVVPDNVEIPPSPASSPANLPASSGEKAPQEQVRRCRAG